MVLHAVQYLERRVFAINQNLISANQRVHNWIYKNSDKIMIVAGIALIAGAVPTSAFAQGDIENESIERVIQIILNDMIGGAFGALIMIVAGLVAIISASMGAYRAAMSALVVAVGAFVLRAVVIAFWPTVNYGE